MSTDLRIEQLMMRSHRGQSLINQFDGWDLRQRVFVILHRGTQSSLKINSPPPCLLRAFAFFSA